MKEGHHHLLQTNNERYCVLAMVFLPDGDGDSGDDSDGEGTRQCL